MKNKFTYKDYQDLDDLSVGDYVYVKGFLNHHIVAEAVGFIGEIGEHTNYGTYLFPDYFGKYYMFIYFYKDDGKYSTMQFVNINEIYKLKFDIKKPNVKNILPIFIKKMKKVKDVL